jgi:cytochrome c oxidase subunit 2
VTAAKWNWRFDYLRTGVSQGGHRRPPPTLVVPTGVPVRFHLRSRDVIHAFWIPERRFKRDAIPGRVTTFDLVFDHPGQASSGICAEFCGLRHGDMRFIVRRLTPGDFRDWLRRRGAR